MCSQNIETAIQTMEESIYFLITTPDTQPELYDTLHTLAARLGTRLGIPAPEPDTNLPYLLDLSQWIGYARAFALQQTPLPPASHSSVYLDQLFVNLMEQVKRQSSAALEQQMSRAFLSLKPEIRSILVDYVHRFPFWGDLRLNSGTGSMVTERAQCLKEHRKDFLWLYDRLADYRSRFSLLAVLNQWLFYDSLLLGKAKETIFEDYFDLDLPLLGDPQAVIADVGAFTGDTALAFQKVYGSCKKLYCYEVDPANCEKARKTLQTIPFAELRQKAVSAANGTIYLNVNSSDASASRTCSQGSVPIEAVTLDSDIPEPLSLIKMDIEGGEQEALAGCERHIREDRCQLAISVYHGNQDLWKIPRMIERFRSDYQFFLRYNGGNLFPTELIFFAL